MSFVEKTQQVFVNVKDALFNDLKEGEELGLHLLGEDTLYARFNSSKVRQTTCVEQRHLEMTFQSRGRRLVLSCDLTGDTGADQKLLRSLLQRARGEVDYLPEDPGCSPLENRGRSQNFEDARELQFDEVLQAVRGSTEGTEFTGFLASGPQISANANNKGQDHWFSTRSFFLDYSLYTVNDAQENKAVKATEAGKSWSAEKFAQGLATAKSQLNLLKKPNRDVKPGDYSVYLTPAAVSDLVQMLSWGALSFATYKKGGCALRPVADGQTKLSPKFHLRENFDLGLVPLFNSFGEVPERQIDLIRDGEIKNFLVSTRTAREFGVKSNFADNGFFGPEALRSPEVRPGSLSERQALTELGTGLYLGNLHYCNWSDVQSARVTGMTRYACFWVERGEIVAPIRDLRFDVSLLQVFGDRLRELTREQHIIPAVDTYVRRSLGGQLLPGMWIDGYSFTL